MVNLYLPRTTIHKSKSADSQRRLANIKITVVCRITCTDNNGILSIPWHGTVTGTVRWGRGPEGWLSKEIKCRLMMINALLQYTTTLVGQYYTTTVLPVDLYLPQCWD